CRSPARAPPPATASTPLPKPGLPPTWSAYGSYLPPRRRRQAQNCKLVVQGLGRLACQIWNKDQVRGLARLNVGLIARRVLSADRLVIVHPQVSAVLASHDQAD